MTAVSVTNNVAEICVTDDTGNVVVVERKEVAVVAAVVEGPQGPVGPTAPPVERLGDIGDVDTANVVDKSILVYDSSSATYRADSTWTTQEVVNGGNF